MQALEKTIINARGIKGKEWLDNLHKIINELSQVWNLEDLKPIGNMSWNYVAAAMQDNDPVVIKISCDNILDEYNALQAFQGQGSIKLLGINQEHNALLLQRAGLGESLKMANITLQEKLNIYAYIVHKLKSTFLPENHKYRHVSEWLEVIDKISDSRIEKHLVKKASELKSLVLGASNDEYLCNGDLHLENIISHGDNWLAIDPKGIIGEMAFEVAAFDLISKEEIEENHNIQFLILERSNLLAKATGVDINRLLYWIFLRAIISAQWSIEDKDDPSFMIKMAENVYDIVKTKIE